MKTFTISKENQKRINALIADAGPFNQPHNMPENYSKFRQFVKYAHQLPSDLVDFLVNFKYEENNDGVVLVKGFDVDAARIAATPAHWRDPEAAVRTQMESIYLLLCASLLGDPIGWSTQQDGKIVHDIVPIKGDEYKQVGSSALTELWWHTEEAFHPFRCDYLALLCLKNNEAAATTFASVNALQISPEDRKVLFEPHFTILPDVSHLAEENGKEDTAGMSKMKDDPDRTAVLFGNFDQPYLCIDPYYMGKKFSYKPAEKALENIVGEINNHLQRVVLQPGDMIFLDNYRVVHGREPFNARYDGTGRWLKRVNIVRDLRKSRAARNAAESRIIETA